MEAEPQPNRVERISTKRSPLLRRLKQGAALAAKNTQHTLAPKNVPRKLFVATPYYSQWESPEMVSDLMQGKRRAEDDPKWRESGAKTEKEYALWSWSCCGMACLKMVLARRTGGIHPIISLAHEVEKYGGYRASEDFIDGLYYKPLCTYLQEKHQLSARPVPALPIHEIISALAKGEDVILSVVATIRFPESQPPSRGGHLVLVVGYDLDKEELYIHNPSGFYGETQEAAPITFKQLKKFFDYKGVIIK